MHRYYYRIIVSNEPLSVFEKDRAWHLLEQLNIPAMQEACKFLVGHHDFSSFRASGCQAKSPIKTLDELHVRETPCWMSSCLQPLQKECDKENVREAADVMVQSLEKGTCRKDDHATANPPKELSKPHCYVITARARSFLYHQVRLMVGLLKAVGTGDLQVRDVSQILEARTVTKAPPMAPACGLYLGDVKYEFET
ncbi:hypothetical protein KP509_07G095900 [Ceratopteris richardii]|uniref:tRNA pseudouridine synthase n=1 Tax=Ceratopteris richardii TaxID=49495 RepID=A0A8T2UKX1_CERRI|nr:hypothetical protein KP509_07G095900 [Ceratopteris richardii]